VKSAKSTTGFEASELACKRHDLRGRRTDGPEFRTILAWSWKRLLNAWLSGVSSEPHMVRHVGCCRDAMCIVVCKYTHHGSAMRTNIEIDDALMAEAQKASGHATKKQTVEQALRLMIRLRQQREVDAAFGKYRWRGNLARSRKGRGTM